MPSGLEAWDEYGNKTVSLTSRIARRIGSVTTVAGQAGFIDVPGFSDGEPYSTPVCQSITGSLFYPGVTISGNRMSWSAAPQVIIIEYGVR